MHDKPLMVIPHEQMLQKNIRFRKVYIILHDKQGKILTLKSDKYPIHLPSASVYAGEAREHVALNIINSIFKLSAENPIEIEPYNFEQNKYDTFFVAMLNAEHKKTASSKVLWLDLDELHGFATHFTDMLNAKLLDLLNQGQLQSMIKQTN